MADAFCVDSESEIPIAPSCAELVTTEPEASLTEVGFSSEIVTVVQPRVEVCDRTLDTDSDEVATIEEPLIGVSPVDSTTSVTVTVVLKTRAVVMVKAVTCELSESDSDSTVAEVPAVALVVSDTSRLELLSVREISSTAVSVRVEGLDVVTGKTLVEESSVPNEAVPVMLMESGSRFVTAEEPVLIGEVLLLQAVGIWTPAVVDASPPEVLVTWDDPEAVVPTAVRASEVVVPPALALEAADGAAVLVSNTVDKERVEIPRERV
jgi:hypothetical protein